MGQVTYIDKTFDKLSGHFKNTTFYNCTFKDMAGAVLENCDLNHSKLEAKTPEQMLNLTVTLNCLTFHNLELSEEALDFILMLLCKTKGNVEKRRALLELIGHDKAIEILKKFSTVE